MERRTAVHHLLLIAALGAVGCSDTPTVGDDPQDENAGSGGSGGDGGSSGQDAATGIGGTGATGGDSGGSGGSGEGGADGGGSSMVDSGPAPVLFTLSVATTGSGSGSVDFADHTCPGTCSADYEDGTDVTLSATPAASSVFDGWEDDCDGSGTGDCDLTLDDDHSALARFTLKHYTLSVSRTGAGTGAVSASAGAIDCGATCQDDYDHGQMVTLTATPNGDSMFEGWGGACSGTEDCVVTVDAARGVTADFALLDKTMKVLLAGMGSDGGRVVSDVGGIDCPGSCQATLPHGTIVTLTATTTSPGVDFDYMATAGNPCSSPNVCMITLDWNGEIPVYFTLQKRTLSVAVTEGLGTVTVKDGAPGPIDCPGTCSAELDYGTQLTLVATPEPGYAIKAWSDDCVAVGAATECTVTMDGAVNTGVAFSSNSHSLEVTAAGDGAGGLAALVTSDPTVGFACHHDDSGCQMDITDGTVTTLTVNPPPWADFKGWTGACTGGGPTCQLTIDADRSVGVTFVARGNLAFLSPSNNGALGGLSGADDLCGDAASAHGLPGHYLAWLSSSSVDAITRLQGANNAAGGWVTTGGLHVADDIADLTDGWLDNPIASLADGSLPLYDSALTNTNTDGTRIETDPAMVCDDWTTGDDSATSHVAFASAVDDKWATQGSALNACWSSRIACLQTDLTDRNVASPIKSDYYVFTTSNTITGGAGRTAMNALCQTEADKGSVTMTGGGTYAAWLMDDNEAGGAQVDTTQVYLHTNGAPVSASVLAGDPTPYYPETAFSHTADGDQKTGDNFWVGAENEHCTNWSTSAGKGRVGNATRAKQWLNSGGSTNCLFDKSLLCYRAAELP